MHYFFFSLGFGSGLIALLLLVFFNAGKKSKKQRLAERELVMGCGDNSLIHLWEQSESENERDGIIEFIREKLSLEAAPPQAAPPQAAPPEQAPLQAAPLEQESPPEQASPEQASPEQASPEQESLEQESPDPIVERRAISGLWAETETKADIIPMAVIDWQAVEEDMQKKREQEARISAENQHIQEVLSKIRDVEQRLMTDSQQPGQN